MLKNEKTNLGNETLMLHVAELLMKLIIKIYTLCWQKTKSTEKRRIWAKKEKQKRQTKQEQKEKEIIMWVDKNKNSLDQTEKQLEQKEKTHWHWTGSCIKKS